MLMEVMHVAALLIAEWRKSVRTVWAEERAAWEKWDVVCG